jgi:hypothetical protein
VDGTITSTSCRTSASERSHHLLVRTRFASNFARSSTSASSASSAVELTIETVPAHTGSGSA